MIDIAKSSSSVNNKPIIVETQAGSNLEPCLVQPTITHSLTVSDRELSSVTRQGTLDYNKLHTHFFIITIDGYPVSTLSDETVTGSSLEPSPQPTTMTVPSEQSLVTSSVSGTLYY